MKYDLSALKTNIHVKNNLDKMLRLHNMIQDWNEIKDIDENQLHTLAHEVMHCNPFLYKELEGDWQEIYKYLGAQAVLAHRTFFEVHDESEYHHLAAILCQLHDYLTAKLKQFTV